MVPENIHYPRMDGHWTFRGGGGSQRPNFLKESGKLNRNFQRGGGGGGSKLKTIHGESMDIFWNHTLEKAYTKSIL